MPDWIGWVATATFASSYFCKQPTMLRRVQGLAALLWMSYGFLIHALPVIIANMVVAAIALFFVVLAFTMREKITPLRSSSKTSAALPPLRFSVPLSAIEVYPVAVLRGKGQPRVAGPSFVAPPCSAPRRAHRRIPLG